MSSDTGSDAILELEPTETLPLTFFIIAFFFRCLATLSQRFHLSAAEIATLLESLGRLWTNYYPRLLVFDGVMPPLNFVFTGLLGFAEIKSQGQTGFPFQTHPRATMLSVTSLLVYGVASATELVIPNPGLHVWLLKMHK